jgi:hypothetical protein
MRFVDRRVDHFAGGGGLVSMSVVDFDSVWLVV